MIEEQFEQAVAQLNESLNLAKVDNILKQVLMAGMKRGYIDDTLLEMEQDLQSAISYAGGRQLMDLKYVDYVIVKNSIVNGDSY